MKVHVFLSKIIINKIKSERGSELFFKTKRKKNVCHNRRLVAIFGIQIINTLRFFSKNRQVILYGITLAVLLFVLRWLELRFIVFEHAFELYAAAIAIIFTLLGIWLAMKLTNPKTVIVEKEIPAAEFVRNESERLNISKRELEVLGLMAKGMSNVEIGEALFVSTNTIKTHGARLFEKLEVNRRTQAIEKAKRIRLIP